LASSNSPSSRLNVQNSTLPLGWYFMPLAMANLSMKSGVCCEESGKYWPLDRTNRIARLQGAKIVAPVQSSIVAPVQSSDSSPGTERRASLRPACISSCHLRTELCLMSMPLTHSEERMPKVIAWLQYVLRHGSSTPDTNTCHNPAVVGYSYLTT
jgi:hypothetical protein